MLVVGAGPVGLVAAIALRELGVNVRIIEELSEEEKRPYPVILHPKTLRVLEAMGLSAPFEWRGHAITRLAIYTDKQRRTVLELPPAGRTSGGGLTLPHDVLRSALVLRLSELGTKVEWRTRLASLTQADDVVRSRLVRRQRSGEAPPFRSGGWVDVEHGTAETEFVIGADGVRSTVRDGLGISWLSVGPRQSFWFFDAQDPRAGSEAQLVFQESDGNSVYPLQSGVSRFTFQLRGVAVGPPTASQLRALLAARMPWYPADTQSIEWSGSSVFQPAMAERFGRGRVWLAGDAAHSLGPLGAQSLNGGIQEARDLARLMVARPPRLAEAALEAEYTEERRLEWQTPLGIGPKALQIARSEDWVRRHLPLLLQALPASGHDLDDMLDRLQVRAA